jgi:predicted O-linked N-acetylglucosamine transferase (SPINDLY family)
MFAWKPAPVQASWLGYFATTGLAEMDYALADPYVAPAGEENQFTEAVWRLPETYLCFAAPAIDVDVGPLPALSSSGITFGCFNNLAKMNEAVVALWARVLHAVPGSRLFLKTKQLSSDATCEATRKRYQALGIGAERLIFEGASPRHALLAAYRRVDIALDPFPYPGGTTSVEALWMGVPVITRRGDRFLSHVGESIACNAGLAEWVANDDDDYVAVAARHARHLEKLATLRGKLRARVMGSPLFDAPRFARHFEAAMWGMWDRHRSRQDPPGSAA